MDERIAAFLEAASIMNEWTLSVSLGGMTTILLVWSAYYGIKDGLNLRGFRWPIALILPFAAFVSSVLAVQVGYHAAVAGYRWEVLREKWKDGGEWKPVSDPTRHFLDQYAEMLQASSAAALFCAATGIVIVAAWFVANIVMLRKRKRTS